MQWCSASVPRSPNWPTTDAHVVRRCRPPHHSPRLQAWLLLWRLLPLLTGQLRKFRNCLLAHNGLRQLTDPVAADKSGASSGRGHRRRQDQEANGFSSAEEAWLSSITERCAPEDNKTTSSLAPYSVRSFGPLGQNHMVGWRFCLGNPDDKTPAWPHVHCGFIWTSRC